MTRAELDARIAERAGEGCRQGTTAGGVRERPPIPPASRHAPVQVVRPLSPTDAPRRAWTLTSQGLITPSAPAHVPSLAKDA
jgi:hypothetical protein